MAFYPYMCSLVDNPVSDVPVTDAPVITDAMDSTVNTVGGLAADFTDRFLNMDFTNEIILQYAKVFAMGFAFATLLILLTYGVFKAFSLVRIDS